MLCGILSTECCHYYDNDMCVEECPDDKVADPDPDNFTCVIRTFYNIIDNKLFLLCVHIIELSVIVTMYMAGVYLVVWNRSFTSCLMNCIYPLFYFS